MSTKKKILIGVLLAAVIGAVIAFAADPEKKPDIYFSGIRLAETENGMQGFVDVSLRNTNATSVSYCLEYDTTKLKLSDAATNMCLSMD